MRILSVRTLVVIVLLSIPAFSTLAQIADTTGGPSQDWFLKDPETDRVQGMSVEKAYATLLQGKPSRTVIVAVVDSGVDIDHEDLKGVIWTNEKEIPDNGIDDDKNGYIDDVHGWNFIGGKNGNVAEDTYELTREFIRLRKKFATVDTLNVPKKLKAEYEQFLKIKDKYQKLKAKNTQTYEFYSNIYANLSSSIDTMKQLLKTDKITTPALEQFNTNDPNLLYAKGLLLSIFKQVGDIPLEDFMKGFKEDIHTYEVIVKYGYNESYNSREIVGDNYADPNERIYGNNDVKGPDATHGTHVAGIIGANRKNDIGIKGIADNVRIMSVRAVPNGDERDKDVANAIRYAVDNGAKIINMSFGKGFSPEKEVVDKAVKYAEQKGVLLIHAAGNESQDTDDKKNFPSRDFLDGKVARNWLEIGASAWGSDENFVASFSNYGKKTVDFFAPGVEIYSTTPGNTYKNESGTSMACPSTVGVAAILMSYYPEFSSLQIRDILENSTRKFDNLMVQKPGQKEKVNFSQLSVTGGMVNAYQAVKLAEEMKGKKRVK